MALDIYAGGFVRFYAREWENIVQKQARETGQHYVLISARGDAAAPDWETVRDYVRQWKDAMLKGLGGNAPADLDWSETREAPYFTDRPGWAGYSALKLMAAAAALDEPMPRMPPEDALESELIERACSPEGRGSFLSITQSTVWLPGSFDFIFRFVDPSRTDTSFASVRDLQNDLKVLQRRHNVSDEALVSALKDDPRRDPDCLTMATYGLSVFSSIAQQASTCRLPIMLSF